MIHFDKISHNNALNKHKSFLPNLQEAAILFEKLGIGKFDNNALEMILDNSLRDKYLSEAVQKPVKDDLDRLNVQNEELRKANIAAATKSQRELIKQINSLVSVRPLNLENDAFSVHAGTITFSDDWLEKLEKVHTVLPDSSNRKKFAKSVADFETAYNELIKILPKNVKVFSNQRSSIGGDSIFILEGSSGSKIKTVNTKVLKMIK